MTANIQLHPHEIKARDEGRLRLIGVEAVK